MPAPVKVPFYEKDPRWPRFVELLMDYQNADRAAREAGYAPSTARVQSHMMAQRVLGGLKAALWRKGVAVDRMADKLVQLFDAKAPKWNADTKTWDTFENTDAQVAAYDRIKAVLEPAPPQRLEVDIRVGVQRDETRLSETPEQWEARNAGRRTRSVALDEGQALIALTDPDAPGAGNGHNGSNGHKGNGNK